jgi:large subunit ribosomal protein L18
MSLIRKISQRKQRRTLRARKHIKAVATLPRVSVFRSLKQLYAQIIDDNAQKTLVSASSRVLVQRKGDKKEQAKAVGFELAKKAKAAGIEAVYFDRGSYLYHGRVAALAEGLREGGLKV